MTTVFHERQFGRFIRIQNNLRRMKRDRMKQAYIFLKF